MQDFFSYLDPNVVAALPKIKIVMSNRLDSSVLGQYNHRKKVLTINLNRYRANKKNLESTIYHELTHWLHDHAPPEKKELVKAYFKSRTKGEKLKQLPGYGRETKGFEDDFGTGKYVYAGRVYSWEKDDPQGLELATRHLEVLALEDENLAEKINEKGKTGKKMFREAFFEMLNLMY